MDSFELNKIMGAILATCLVLLVSSFTASAVFAPKKLEKPGYDIAVKEDDHAGAAKEAAPPRGADREAAADRFCREGRCRCQEMRGVPYLRQRRPQPRRPEPVWHRQ